MTDLGRTCYRYKLADGSTSALSIEGSIGDCFWLMSRDEMSTLSYAPPSVLDIHYKTHAVPESGTTWLPQNLQVEISPTSPLSKKDSQDIAVWKPSVTTANALLQHTKLQSNELCDADLLSLCNLQGRIIHTTLDNKLFNVELSGRQQQEKNKLSAQQFSDLNTRS